MLRFSARSIRVNRPHRMKHKPRWEIAGRGGHGTSRWAATLPGPDAIQLRHNCWSTRAMDRSIDAASTAQGGIGRIANGVYGHLRDVAANQTKGLFILESALDGGTQSSTLTNSPITLKRSESFSSSQASKSGFNGSSRIIS